MVRFMEKESEVISRKSDHIRINIKEDVRSALTTGLERYRFVHQALPEIDLESVNLRQQIFGKTLQIPLLISSMTGGTLKAEAINRNLAKAAQAAGMAMGVGSQRAALEDTSLQTTFQVRKDAPDILLFANLGAVQLNYGYTLDHCRRAVEMIEADALVLHLNPLQEALQPEGETRFAGLLGKIEMICRQLPLPVVVKEVGWGISEKTAASLAAAGVAAIDVAGAGGTSWSQVEMHRIHDAQRAQAAAAFRGWGIPTADSILSVRRGAPDTAVFASGGLRNGIDIAKCLALGASLAGMAGELLKAASQSFEQVIRVIERVRLEMAICMFVSGAMDLPALRNIPLLKDDETWTS